MGKLGDVVENAATKHPLACPATARVYAAEAANAN